MAQVVQRIETDPWLQRARVGDAAAWGPILERYGGSVYGLCRRLDPAPDDCCQEVWMKVVAHIAEFDSDRGNFLGWVHTIAHRHIIDRRRRRGRRGAAVPLEVGLHASGVAPDRMVSRHEASRRLEAALARLPAAQRQAVGMYRLSGVSLQDIADAEGVALGTIKSRLH